MTSGWRPALISATLALFIGLTSAGHDFVMEEQREVILENLAIRDLKNIPLFFAGPWMVEGLGRNYYRPVVTSLYALEHAVFGFSPMGWHVINALLYAGVTALMALLILRIVGNPRAALGGGILFALLPVHAEPLSCVSYQTVLLAGLFTALALHTFAKMLYGAIRTHRVLLLGVFTAAGIMSKEEAYTIPALVLALALAARPPNWKRAAVTALAVTGPVAGMLLVWRAFLVEPIRIEYFAGLPADTIVFTMLRVVVHYAELLIIPLRMSAFYDWWIIPPQNHFSGSSALGLGILLLIAMGAAIAIRRKNTPIAAGLAWILIGLAPVSQILPFVVVAADRYLFIPSMGWCLAICGLTVQLGNVLPGKWRKPALGFACAMLLAYGARSVYRIQDWRDDMTLNAATIRDFPATPAPHLNLAAIYQKQGNQLAAKAELEKARRLGAPIPSR